MEKTTDEKFDLEAYREIREEGVPWLVLEKRGLIAVSGGEAVQFLNGLITNDVAKLEEDAWMLAAFPNAKGRLTALVRIDKEDERFVFETETATYERLLANLQRFTFAGDFQVEDLSNSKTVLSVRGGKAADALGAVLDGGLKPGRDVAIAKYDGTPVRVIPALRTAGFDLRIASERAGSLAEDLVRNGAVSVGGPLAEALRVESGIPLFGVDMNEETVVPEIGLEGLISYQKGCYIGQEVIARIHFRGKVAKELKGVIFESPDAPVSAGDELLSSEGKNAGFVTSVTYSPKLGRHIAMAMVRNNYLEAGTELNSGGQACMVCDLPFIN